MLEDKALEDKVLDVSSKELVVSALDLPNSPLGRVTSEEPLLAVAEAFVKLVSAMLDLVDRLDLDRRFEGPL